MGVICHGAVGVRIGVVTKRVVSIAPSIVQACLLGRTLLLDIADGGLLMGRSWTYSERRRVLGLVGVVLGSRGYLVLQVNGICPLASACTARSASSLAVCLPALMM